MNSSFFSYIPIIKHLLHADFLHFKKDFFNKCIDRLLWMSLTVGLRAYCTAAEFNTTSDLGLFTLGSALASSGFLDIYYSMFLLVQDFEGEQTIYYYLNLPLSASLYFIKQIIYYGIRAFIMGLPIILIGKILLWNSFDVSITQWPELIVILFVSSFLFGSMTLFFASILPNLSATRKVWARYLFPLWWFGGFMHSWGALHKISPILSYLALLNPVTYVMEGTRNALMGTTGAISFIWCLIAIIGFTILHTIVSLRILKKRLDWV